MPTGDRVIFKLPNQRVDKKDLEDISILNQEILSRTIGALIGDTSGVLTNVPYSWSNATQTISFGTFALAWGGPERSGPDNTLIDGDLNTRMGGIIVHDPTRPGQEGFSELDLTAASNRCHLWFKRREVETDIDNRAYWSSDTESVTQTATRSREIVVFLFTNVENDLSAKSQGWNRFAVFFKPSGVLLPLSAFGDNKPVEDLGSLEPNGLFMGLEGVGGGTPAQRPWGIGRLAQELISAILKTRDSQIVIDPNTRAITANPNATRLKEPVARGVVQLNRDLTRLTTDVSDLWDSANNSRVGVLATIVHTPAFSTPGLPTPDPVTSFHRALINVTIEEYSSWGGSGDEGENTPWWAIMLDADNLSLNYKFPTTSSSQSVVTPPAYDTAVVTSVIVQPHHPATWQDGGTYTNETQGAGAELQQWKPFPCTLTGSPVPPSVGVPAIQKLKLRFRDFDGADAQTTGRGWTMTVFGYLTRAAEIGLAQ